MCRAEIREKADFLIDLTLHNSKDKTKNVKVDWSDERMNRALRMLIYFSEVLPVSFINHYKESDVIYEVLLGKEDATKQKKRN